MGSSRSRWPGAAMNAALLILGALAIVLTYSLVTRALTPRVDPVRENGSGHLVGDIIQVEVRNGCGVAGLAAETTMFLRQHGFDVVEVGDFHRFDEAHSRVVDRVGDLESAKKVASVLGISEDRVEQDIGQEYYLDATIILGSDYETLRPFEAE